MDTNIKSVSLTKEEVAFYEDNEISLTQLCKEAIHSLMRQQNSMLVQNLRAKSENDRKTINKLQEQLLKTEKMFEEVKGGLNVKS